MRFESPFALLLLLFAPLLLESSLRERLLGRSRRENKRAVRFISPVSIEHLPLGFRVRLRALLLSVLQVGAFTLLVIALARPQFGRTYRESEASGRDIMLALDLSGSMQAMDFFIEGNRVNRLQALQYVTKRFIDAREGDRMGLVVFGDRAFSQCPLTLDHRLLKEFIDALEVGMVGQATAVGEGLAVAIKRMRDIPGKSRTIILVTDGKNNAGRISPEQASDIARKLGVKVHTIGIGGAEPAPFPETTVFGTTRLVNRSLEYDERTLKMIAERTGGMYFNARDLEKLSDVYREIDRLEERRERAAEYVEYDERFFPFVALALALFILSELLSATLLLQVP